MANIHICYYGKANNILKEDVDKCLSSKYDSMVVHIKHPFIHGQILRESVKYLDGFRSDSLLTPTEWYCRVVAKLNSDLDVDSLHEREFIEILRYAEHLMQTGDIMIELKMRKNNFNLARLVSEQLKSSIIVECPLKAPVNACKMWRKDREEEEELDSWNIWNEFITSTSFHPHIKLALVLSEDIPSEIELRRWLGEHIGYIVIPTNLFIPNNQNYPVLSREHQQVLIQLMKFTPNFMIKECERKWKTSHFSNYIQFLANQHIKSDSMTNYENLLETPLQPLHHDLDSYTYEVFEKDPVKYKLYQEAIEAALVDRVPENERAEKVVVIMVLGAGRGPLVRASINAGKNTGIKLKIYVVEKNPNAILTLRANIKELWLGSDLTLYSCDMRDFHPPESADIIVSELLGSFGDNELSPECLDGAQKHLKPDGISIPCNSISYVNPVMSSKLYNGCRAMDRYKVASERAQVPNTQDFETTYVVYPKSVFHIDEPKKLFTFVHPNKENSCNDRNGKLTFKAEVDCVLNGFIGYFESTLYKDIMISIHPSTHTMGMPSWFPLFIPIATPQFVRAGQEIEAHFWRCSSQHQVWYEWCVTKPCNTFIHNLNGDCCSITK